jgi:hypothetical protein
MSVLRAVLDSGLTVALGTGAWLIGVTVALVRLQAKHRAQPVEQRVSIPRRRDR